MRRWHQALFEVFSIVSSITLIEDRGTQTLAEVHIRERCIGHPSVSSSLAEKVVELANIAWSSQLDDTSAPPVVLRLVWVVANFVQSKQDLPTTSFDIRAPGITRVGLGKVESSCLLSRIIGTRLGGTCPRLVTFDAV